MVKEIQANLCFSILGKNLKIQNGRHFWGEEIFLKSGEKGNFSPLHRILLYYPEGQKFALSLTVFEIFTLFHFQQKSKMAVKSGEN